LLERATVDRGISPVGKKRKVIKDDWLDMFLPAKARVNTTLDEAVHRDSKIFNSMSLEKCRNFFPPFRLALTNVVYPGAIYFEPGFVAIKITRIRSALESIGDVEVKELGLPQRTTKRLNSFVKPSNKDSLDKFAPIIISTEPRHLVFLSRSLQFLGWHSTVGVADKLEKKVSVPLKSCFRVSAAAVPIINKPFSLRLIHLYSRY
jgi:hypothetical protein